jgi:hypothetical protein
MQKRLMMVPVRPVHRVAAGALGLVLFGLGLFKTVVFDPGGWVITPGVAVTLVVLGLGVLLLQVAAFGVRWGRR